MKHKNILVVEDELLVALVYQQYLEMKGYTIVGPFTTGEEALLFVENNLFYAALVDVQLDDHISGLAVAEKIREKSDAPIVFTTGNDSQRTLEESAHISNSFILPKPVDFNELLKILC